eukprot:3561602-Amphidinium_carterae.2
MHLALRDKEVAGGNSSMQADELQEKWIWMEEFTCVSGPEQRIETQMALSAQCIGFPIFIGNERVISLCNVSLAHFHS